MTRKYLPVLTFTLLLSLLASFVVVAGVPEGTSDRPGSTSLFKPSIFELRAFNPNRIKTDVINRGQFVSWFRTGDAGMEWPAGSGNTINFASGLWIVGKVGGEVRSAAAEFSVEYVPGTVVNGVPQDPNDERFRMYVITRADREAALDNDPATVPGEDYLNWPVQDGAPLDGDGNPLILGDAALWCVFNDMDEAAHANLWSTKPLGVEVQMYLWGFNRVDGFGDMMFMKFTIANKGGNQIDSAYVSFWDDADVGQASDDFVGVDTTLSLGYFWNDGADGVYGPRAPALGYDFFQGPIVPSPGDTAIFNFQKLPDFKNLEMTAFAKYINGGGNDWGDPEDAVQALNYMVGLNRAGVPYTDPETGQVTKFVHAGDPVTGTGWIDPDTHPSGDRRFLMTTGPISLPPGEVQEVVGGMICSQATNNLTSITKLRQLDQAAQAAYDRNFQLPPTPPKPKVKVSELDGRIVLTWDDAAEAYDVPDLIGRQRFQGYNVYQIAGPQVSALTPAVLIATYDVADGFFDPVRDVVFTDEGEVEKVVQPLSDSGIQRFFSTDVDEVRGRIPLINGRKYWFAVTSFGYNPDGSTPVGVPKILESPMEIIEVTPQSPPLGTTYQAAFSDTIAIEHSAGISDGSAQAIVVDPSAVTGHSYKITFTKSDGEITWNVVDQTSGETKVSGWVNQLGGEDYPIVDGLLIKVFGAPNAFAFNEHNEAAGIVEVAYAGEAIPPEGYDAAGAPFGGNTVWHSLNWAGPAGDHDRYYVSAGGGGGALSRLMRYIDFAVPRDFEIRFTAAGGYGVYAFEDDKIATVPFELWDIGVGTPDDPSDDVRMIPFLLSWDSTKAEWGWANGTDPAFGFPASDWVYWMDPEDPTPGSASYDNFAAVAASVGAGGTYPFATDGSQQGYYANFHGGFVYPIGRSIYCDFDQDGNPPPPGSVIRFNTTKPNSTADEFTFSTETVAVQFSQDLAKEQTKLVNVFPNPYYARNMEEIDPLNRFVTFTHLPEAATIRIFTLAGDLVTKIDHQGGQFEQWDLRNADGIPVASGIYIVHIDLGPDLGERVLKMAVFMPEERLDVL